ncbi:hypothetical protein M0805_000070 [Coniferiporia weirii]|nr:hypothetical protein M0805_000070 [Coniferiporia weirii]
MTSALTSSNLNRYLDGFDRSFYKTCVDICASSQSGRSDDSAIMHYFLKGDRPHDSILVSCSCIELQGSTLKALCLGSDKKMHPSSIDLNDHYANSNGSFVSDDNHFVHTSRNLSLQVTSESVLLSADLRDWNSEYQYAEVDLSICIVNDNGRLAFVKHDGLFGRDGILAKFFESVPFVGFIVAGIHAAAGNDDHALRAVSYCANSSIVVCGFAIGAFIGGPIGGALGAGFATPLAILVETEIAGRFITDPRLKAQFEEATIGRYFRETILNLAGGAIGVFSKWIGSITAQALRTVCSKVIVALGKWVAKTSANKASYWFLEKLTEVLVTDRVPQAWLDAESEVKSLKEISERQEMEKLGNCVVTQSPPEGAKNVRGPVVKSCDQTFDASIALAQNPLAVADWRTLDVEHGLVPCYDSDECKARLKLHGTFSDPSSPESAPKRQSIELKALVFDLE